ncbi:MAG: TRAP transporter large permease subunit [Synergistetes bacterium]|nr:TRAP transporter large permease subunit [Synergistota bacterium]
MDSLLASFLLVVGILGVLLVGSIWVGTALFLVGIAGFHFFLDVPWGNILANIAWNSTSSSTMFALPLFVWMGEILFRSKISENLFTGLAPWLDSIPGRLIHVNVFASAIFAAVSGSSAATTATVGKITLPELFKRGYDRVLAIGSLAGSGTLGFMIPPSMMMLVYGILADVSIGKLFIAGVIPGIMIAIFFSGYIMIKSLLDPDVAPKVKESYTWGDRIKAIPKIAPAIILVVMVLGSIYTGWATPTEAAAVGVAGSILFAWLMRSLDLKIFKEALIGAVKTSCMIMWIVCGATFFSVAVGYLGITQGIAQYVASLGLSKYTLIAILSIMYLILGCLVDGFSMIVMTLPMVLPLIKLSGFDPLWFGIYLVIMIQLAQITPPVGFNLFVIKGLIGEELTTIAKAAFPFFLLLLLATAIITVFPGIVLYLPSFMVK